MDYYYQHVDGDVKDSIISFTNDLPDHWSPQIPDQNVDVDGCARPYNFEEIEYLSRDNDISIFYYINKPINEEYFLTIWASTKDDDMSVEVEVVLSEGSEVADLLHIDREPEYYTIERQEIESKESLESYFESIKNVVSDYIVEYDNLSLNELKERTEDE